MSLLSTNSALHHLPAAGRSIRNVWRMTHLLGLMRSRRALRGLSDAQLQDVGVTREQAQKEAQRPIWDVPETWVD